MNDQSEGIKTALEVAAGHPKVASSVAVVTTAMGTASLMSEISTVLGVISLGIGCIVGLYVLRINHIKHKIYERMYERGESLKE